MTSPIANLSAKLPKGNGLTRAAEELHGHNGALVPFVGYLEVDQSGEDKNDVLKVWASIQRLELCTGELERDARDLISRASHAANSYPGQLTLMAEPGSAAAVAEERDRYVGYLREWQKEQTPPVSDADAGKQWHDFSGGNYGALDQASPAYLLEFLLNIGALPDDEKKSDDSEVPGPEFSDEPDDDATPDES